MVSCFVCGASSLPQDEEDDQQYKTPTRSAGFSPRKSRSNNNKNKNPYSSRGLDKFSALLEEIEDKRQQIYTKVDPDNIAFICFKHTSGDHEFKPMVIVKSSKPKAAASTDHKTIVQQQSPPLSRRLPSSSSMVVVDKTTTITAKEFVEKKGLYQLKECPKLYLPIMFIIVLVLMSLFGRSFAIVCTSVGWYVIPTFKSDANSTTSRKKNYVMPRLSTKKKPVNVESFEGV